MFEIFVEVHLIVFDVPPCQYEIIVGSVIDKFEIVKTLSLESFKLVFAVLVIRILPLVVTELGTVHV